MALAEVYVAKSFRDLKVWQLAINLSVMVYELTEAFPRQEQFGLSSQMQRAGVSVASNIAEGSARGTRKDFRQFVLIAKGSVCELQTQLIIAHRRRYVDGDKFAEMNNHLDQVAQMLSGPAKYLNAPSLRKTN